MNSRDYRTGELSEIREALLSRQGLTHEEVESLVRNLVTHVDKLEREQRIDADSIRMAPPPRETPMPPSLLPEHGSARDWQGWFATACCVIVLLLMVLAVLASYIRTCAP